MQASEMDYEVGDLVYRQISDGEIERGEVTEIKTDTQDKSWVCSVVVLWEEDDAYGEYRPQDLRLARKSHEGIG